MYDKFKEFLSDNQKICIIQAENPDGDSLGSAVALDYLLGDREISLYCPVDIPQYLHYFEDWSPHPYGIELANREEIEDMLMDVTRCGLKHFHNNSTFNAYFGYMFKVMPYFFKDYNGDYVGWQQKGISMMRYSYMLDSLNPLAKAMYYEIDCDNESDYIQACQELWKQIDPIEWGQSEVQMYFYSVLNGNAS